MPTDNDTRAPASATLTAFVRAAGSDLDEMGPPGLGRYYLVLEIPQGHNAMVQDALLSGRIQIHAAPCRIVHDKADRRRLTTALSDAGCAAQDGES